MIELKSIKKRFGNDEILKGVNLTFNKGEFYSIIGRSGCGKSTMLRIINGLENPDSGDVLIDGEKLTSMNERKMRQKVGMVFQSFQLFNHMSLIQNIVTPLTVIKKISKDEAHEIGLEYLGKVGLRMHAQKFPHQLSGGQQQRGAIARALSMKPDYMLYDEPTSALDPELALEVHQVMKSVDHAMTQIIVTHEMKFARDISDQVIYMHQGIVEEIGSSSEIFSNPKKETTKEFLRNFI